MRSGKRILSCLLSFAIAATMMSGLVTVQAGAENEAAAESDEQTFITDEQTEDVSTDEVSETSEGNPDNQEEKIGEADHDDNNFGGYNVAAAIEYAKNYYYRNTNDTGTWYGNNGGDCAYFVSRCLSNGGISVNYTTTGQFRDYPPSGFARMSLNVTTSGIPTGGQNAGKISQGDVLLYTCACGYPHVALVGDVSGSYVKVYSHTPSMGPGDGYYFDAKYYICGKSHDIKKGTMGAEVLHYTGGVIPPDPDPDTRGYYMGAIKSTVNKTLALHWTRDYNDSSISERMPAGALIIVDPSYNRSGETYRYVNYNGRWGYASGNFIDSSSSKINASQFTAAYTSYYTYNGSYITPSIKVYPGEYQEWELTQGLDYTVSYGNNLNPGTGSITVTGCGKYFTGSKTFYFTIYAKSLSNCTTSTIYDQTYTGSEITPSVSVYDGNTTLTKDVDYTVSHSSNTNVGTASVTITGIGNYTGTVTKSFYINKRDLSNFSRTTISDQRYTGSAIKPSISVYDSGKILTNGTDYNVSYENNIEPGTAYVTITGIGNYTGTITDCFNIIAKDFTKCSLTAIPDQIYTGSAITPSVSVYDGSVLLTKGTDYTTEYSNNKNVGTATVTITGKGEYSGKLTTSFRIISTTPTVTATAGDKQVTLKWNAISGATKYAVSRYDGSKYIEINYKVTGTSYTVKNLTNGKAYKFLVQAYVGGIWSPISTTLLVSATPKASVNPVVTATAGDKQVTLKWNTVSGATKYAVSRYDGSKYIEINYKVTGTSYTVKNLKNGTKYQFLVQSYVNGEWSAISKTLLVSATPKASVNPVVTATAGDKQVTLKWNTVSGATKYAVSRYDGSKYIEINYNVTGTSYTVKNLKNGTKYQFLVQSYVNGKWSSISTTLLISATPKASQTVTPPNVTATASNNQVTLKWNAISGATKYAVSIYDNGKYVEEDYNITGTSYTVRRLTNGKTYKFLVQAYVSGKWSSSDTKYLVSAIPGTTSSGVPVVTATPGNGTVTLKWNMVSGATKYAISIYENGNYIEEDYNVTDTSYTVRRLTNGKTYKFLVQAYVNGKWSSSSTTLLVSATPKA